MPGVDVTGFLNNELKKTKRKLEKALQSGDNIVASRHARRMAELLRELARVRKWGQSELLKLANEYEELAARLENAPPPPKLTGGSQPHGGKKHPQGHGESGSTELDAEFDAQAEELIASADVTWEDIAGLDEVKRSLAESLYYSIARPSDPEVRVEPPRRFLLYGPPGTGKTMLAMAASRMLGATFINVSVDRVLSRYVGDAPRMISAIFRLARRRAPSIVFFDEVETLVARRDTGREAATGLVQTFLTELDGFKSKSLEKPVIVMAATNKPWLLDEAILSRFEKRIYVPLPDKRAREAIFRLHLEKRGFKLEGVTYEELAEMTEGYSGRDIANACREAVMTMLRRANPNTLEELLRGLDPTRLEGLTYRVLPIRKEEIVEAIRRVKPPITSEDVRRYIEWGSRV